MSIALIAGTGTGELFAADHWSEVPTPYGPAHIAPSTAGDHKITLLRRHGPGMHTPPHLINHHANIWALRQLGIVRVLATAAVGSLRTRIGPGALVLLTDFVDLSRRSPITAFGQIRACLVHTDFSQPYCPELSQALRDAAQTDLPSVTYTGVDGPRYESPAEVRMMARLGGDVVGMTAVPETILAKEMGMCYACLGIVTNYGTGISAEPLSHDDVVSLVTERGTEVRRILESAIGLVPQNRACRCRGLSEP